MGQCQAHMGDETEGMQPDLEADEEVIAVAEDGHIIRVKQRHPLQSPAPQCAKESGIHGGADACESTPRFPSAEYTYHHTPGPAGRTIQPPAHGSRDPDDLPKDRWLAPDPAENTCVSTSHCAGVASAASSTHPGPNSQSSSSRQLALTSSHTNADTPRHADVLRAQGRQSIGSAQSNNRSLSVQLPVGEALQLHLSPRGSPSRRSTQHRERSPCPSPGVEEQQTALLAAALGLAAPGSAHSLSRNPHAPAGVSPIDRSSRSCSPAGTPHRRTYKSLRIAAGVNSALSVDRERERDGSRRQSGTHAELMTNVMPGAANHSPSAKGWSGRQDLKIDMAAIAAHGGVDSESPLPTPSRPPSHLTIAEFKKAYAHAYARAQEKRASRPGTIVPAARAQSVAPVADLALKVDLVVGDGLTPRSKHGSVSQKHSRSASQVDAPFIETPRAASSTARKRFEEARRFQFQQTQPQQQQQREQPPLTDAAPAEPTAQSAAPPAAASASSLIPRQRSHERSQSCGVVEQARAISKLASAIASGHVPVTTASAAAAPAPVPVESPVSPAPLTPRDVWSSDALAPYMTPSNILDESAPHFHEAYKQWFREEIARERAARKKLPANHSPSRSLFSTPVLRGRPLDQPTDLEALSPGPPLAIDTLDPATPRTPGGTTIFGLLREANSRAASGANTPVRDPAQGLGFVESPKSHRNSPVAMLARWREQRPSPAQSPQRMQGRHTPVHIAATMKSPDGTADALQQT